MKFERGSIQGSSEGALAMVGNYQSVCLAIALFAILRATLYATPEREKTGFPVIHGEEVIFYLTAGHLRNHRKIEAKLCQVIFNYGSPL